MAKLLANKIGDEMCQILGIDPTKVAGLTIHLNAGDVARVIVKRYLESDELESFKQIFEHYELKPKEEG